VLRVVVRSVGKIERRAQDAGPLMGGEFVTQKIVDERRWIAGAITLVVGRGASKEVASKVGLPVT
jgi:hypothetical protein